MNSTAYFYMSTVVIISISIGAIALVALSILMYILFYKKNKNLNRVIVDDKFINDLLNYLGGNSNLESSETENGRLIIKVKDLDIVNLDGIKSLATSGVFVTGNTIKTLFRLDSKIICDALEKRIWYGKKIF